MASFLIANVPTFFSGLYSFSGNFSSPPSTEVRDRFCIGQIIPAALEYGHSEPIEMCYHRAY